MEAIFFPRHLAGLIVLFTVLISAAYWAILAIGTTRGASGPGYGAAWKTKLALLLVGWYGLAYLVASRGLPSTKDRREQALRARRTPGPRGKGGFRLECAGKILREFAGFPQFLAAACAARRRS